MKKLSLFSIFAILIFTFGSEYLMACHEEASGGDGGMWPTLRGHNPTSRQSGFLTTFEGTAAFLSTSTKCDAYTSFIELSYDQIAENAAQGHGPYLDALSSFRDCSINNKDRFQQLIRKHFSFLFENPKNNGITWPKVFPSSTILPKRIPVVIGDCQGTAG